jgi:hypothetical protein
LLNVNKCYSPGQKNQCHLFCIMRKFVQCGKYFRSHAVPPYTSFTVFFILKEECSSYRRSNVPGTIITPPLVGQPWSLQSSPTYTIRSYQQFKYCSEMFKAETNAKINSVWIHLLCVKARDT